MRMQRAQFRIGDLAQKVGVERFVIRFWEKEFNLRSHRSNGGQRFYTHKDVETFEKIKQLLYEQQYTIEGAKKVLKDAQRFVGSRKTHLDPEAETVAELQTKLKELRSQLTKLRRSLG